MRLSLRQGKYLPQYALIAPNAVNILSDKLPALAAATDQNPYLDATAAALEKAGVTFVDVRDTLSQHKDDGIYYHTDHHWTTQGAYFAYMQLAKVLGIDSSSISYDKLPVSMSFYDTRKLETRDNYAMFFNGNHGKVVITTPTEENRTLLVIKDSYANSLIPFLAPYYRKIVMVDPRYFYDDLEELMQVEEIQEVLYLYNANTFYSDTSLELALMPQSSTDSTPDSIETDNTDTASASSDNASADNPVRRNPNKTESCKQDSPPAAGRLQRHPAHV